MRFGYAFAFILLVATGLCVPSTPQVPLHDESNNRTISVKLFAELEELARVVDISYCVGMTGLGIQKPFECISRCSDFKDFELVTTWHTGPLLSDSCGYIALSHPPSPPRIIVAFRGTYSIANTIADLSTVPQEYIPYPGDNSDEEDGESDGRCANCTVHMGFHTSWRHTRAKILPDLAQAISSYPGYRLTLVGHSLGGAVAALAALEFHARGWDPRVTTFGEPRIGDEALAHYIDAKFNLSSNDTVTSGGDWKYRRVTHRGDPVPLLPLEEWGYRMHGGEVFISKSQLPPSVADIEYCNGDRDPKCVLGLESFVPAKRSFADPVASGQEVGGIEEYELDLVDAQSRSTRMRWAIPSIFAHRDYFWRLGLCVPGGGPRDWYRKYFSHAEGNNRVVRSGS